MLRRAEIVVRGRVQGVYFRYTTKKKADDFNVRGWVRNRSDGSVQIVCEGDETDIARLLEWCDSGPQGASVEAVDVAWRAHEGEFTDFRITW